jgi:hypothetical protein
MHRWHATKIDDDNKKDTEGNHADSHRKQPRAAQASLLRVAMGEEQDRSG